MTQQTRTTNKGKFEQGDKPQGSDYVDLIDSYLSLADTSAQTVTSDIIVPTLRATTEVSAVKVNTSGMTVYGIASAASFVGDTVLASAITGTIVSANTVNASSASFTLASAATMNASVLVAQNVSASAVTINGSLTWTAGVTAAVAATGNSLVPTSAVGYIIATVSGQTVGIPYFKVA